MEKVELWPIAERDWRDVPVHYLHPEQIACHEHSVSEPQPAKHEQPSLFAF